MSHQDLAEAIIALSIGETWSAAVPERSLLEVYESGTPEACICRHYPIIEIWGNCCVKKFGTLPSGLIFQAFSRVKRDPPKVA